MSLDESVVYQRDKPKELLKQCLARRLSPGFAYRKKLGFGQPVFEWLAPGGQLRELVDDLGSWEFVDPATLERAKQRPNWFLNNLVCLDQWYKTWF